MTLRTFIKSVVGVCILPPTARSIEANRKAYLIKKWWPVLATDEEYFKTYGHTRAYHNKMAQLSTSILLEAQESYIKP